MSDDPRKPNDSLSPEQKLAIQEYVESLSEKQKSAIQEYARTLSADQKLAVEVVREGDR